MLFLIQRQRRLVAFKKYDSEQSFGKKQSQIERKKTFSFYDFFQSLNDNKLKFIVSIFMIFEYDTKCIIIFIFLLNKNFIVIEDKIVKDEILLFNALNKHNL